jgi:MFS transporter, DHA1 family, inner membrane transport protein
MPLRFPRTALTLGNFVIGLGILAPAGMMRELSEDLSVSIPDAGLLITFGAVVLCFGSPVMAWLTSRMERRTLLVAVLAIVTLGHALSAFAPEYWTLLALRLVLLAAAAVYTPQAASMVALIVPEKERAGAVAYIYLGWSLAIAAGLPLVAFLADTFGWREAYGALAAAGVPACVLLWTSLPQRLLGAPLSLTSWGRVVRDPFVLLLLLNTTLRTAGQFTVITYLGPLLSKTVNAGPQAIGSFFAIFGIAGLAGSVLATSVVGRLGAFKVSILCGVSTVLGALLWMLGSGSLSIMALGVAFIGLGFASSNSMQQGLLVPAAPKLSTASVALNTSAFYVGQAVGSGLGGLLFAQGRLTIIDITAFGFYVAAVAVQMMARPTLGKPD